MLVFSFFLIDKYVTLRCRNYSIHSGFQVQKLGRDLKNVKRIKRKIIMPQKHQSQKNLNITELVFSIGIYILKRRQCNDV